MTVLRKRGPEKRRDKKMRLAPLHDAGAGKRWKDAGACTLRELGQEDEKRKGIWEVEFFGSSKNARKRINEKSTKENIRKRDN